MTLDEEYAVACRPGRGPSIHKRLVPFTVGHFQLLSRLQSPLINEPASMSSCEIATALWVARRPWDVADRKLGSFWMRSWVQSYSQIFDVAPDVKAFWLLQLARWRHYHLQLLPTWDSDKAESSGGVPVLHSIKRVLMGEMGHTLAETLALPIRQAMADCKLFQTANTGGGVISDEQRQFMAEWDRLHGIKD